ncbi:putative adhesin [Haloactinospora alba]|uniref:Putative adhesin n=1 Tax=Haloactinospora alba TaxID=405555 RepID=A0A543N7M8_9ACTN|nr:DUF4097 family beta strand repeat-containing protein [Haloactinospora alba]TQN27831.1 putative adhesin [Haloactinospora alba]
MTFNARGLYASSSKQPRRRTGWLVAGAVLALVVLAVGVVNVTANLAVSEERTSDSFDGASSVAVDNGTPGRVRVSGTDGDTVTVDRTLSSSPLAQPDETVRADGDTVRADARCEGTLFVFGKCAVDYDIGVPAGTAVEVTTSSGAVEVEGVEGDVRASASSGTVTVRDVTGDAELTASSGNVRATGVSGNLDLETSSGGINARPSGGGAETVRARSSSGSIDLREVRTENLEVETSSGSADVAGEFTTAEVRSGSGSISLEAGGAFDRVTADTGSGSVDMRVPDGAYDVTGSTGSGSRDVDVDRDDDADSRIDATTGSGSVSISARD